MIKLATKKDLKHYHEAFIYIDLYVVRFCKNDNAFVIEDYMLEQSLSFRDQYEVLKNRLVLKRKKQAEKLVKLLNHKVNYD